MFGLQNIEFPNLNNNIVLNIIILDNFILLYK